VPDIEIYNKEGYLVPYKDPDNSNPNCNASAGSFISNLKTNSNDLTTTIKVLRKD
jgi:hypothetical protein